MQTSFRIAAYGVVWDESGRILLTRGSARSPYPGAWCLPGGGLKHGENPRDAVAREFLEETGYTVKVVRPRDVLSVVTSSGVHCNGVVFDVVITGGERRPEKNGTSLNPEWVETSTVKKEMCTPFVNYVLQLAVPYSVVDLDRVKPGRRPTPPRNVRRGRKRRGQRFGAYGLTTDDDGRVLLARIAEGYPGGGTWHLPGGGVDFGEQPKDAVKREIVEETGQHAQIGELLDVTSFRHRRAIGPRGYPLDWHGVRAIYRAHVADPSPARVVEEAGGSTSDSRWWNSDEIASLKVSPALADALKVAKSLKVVPE